MQPALPHGLLLSILGEQPMVLLRPAHGVPHGMPMAWTLPVGPCPGPRPDGAMPTPPLYLAAASTFMVVQSTSTGQQPRKLSERATVGSSIVV
jgi:hypothetical protein